MLGPGSTSAEAVFQLFALQFIHRDIVHKLKVTYLHVYLVCEFYQESMRPCKPLMKALIAHNSTNIWRQKTFSFAFQGLDKDLGGRMHKAADPQNKSPNKLQIYEDNAARVMAMLSEVTLKRNSVTSGIRTPQWLKELIQAVDLDENAAVGNTAIVASENTSTGYGSPAGSADQSVDSARKVLTRPLIRRPTNTESEPPDTEGYPTGD